MRADMRYVGGETPSCLEAKNGGLIKSRPLTQEGPRLSCELAQDRRRWAAAVWDAQSGAQHNQTKVNAPTFTS